ncbi:fimbrillin family protein [Phocaeicola plebeius]|uniref:fimbrillin family protein n=1 Tax=Phocaeicola plebeius TaxID=310297 RepID=UPI0026EDB282|nr:fimbrillin family protein [Phocaeicola plebeius]
MKNYFAKSSVALMVVSAALASCTQEEIVQNDVPTRQTLNISVNTQDFVSEDGSRATTGTDENRTTAFVKGDEMGMYVISNDGTVICNNEKFVYDGKAWNAENELYYWKNANYIAYYPYNADLTAQNITKVEEIKTKFTEPVDFYTQNTAEAYEKADLMLAEVNSPANGTIQFDLAHQFSMVEINVPVRKYVTSEAQGSFEYTAPVSLTWTTALKIGDKEVTPYSTGKGSFRFIVPSATDLSLTLDGCLIYDEGVPVYFGSSTEPQSINLASGLCKVYNVTYSEVENTVVTRDLEVGDYYYSDGSIYPYGNQEGDNDKSKPVKDGCIGVIFEVGTGVPNTPWTHGSVLALHDSNGENGIDAWCKWGTAANTIATNIIADITTPESKTELINKKNGYAMSYSEELGSVEAISKAKAYTVEVPGDNVTSGWYLPAMGQLLDVVAKLGGVTVSNTDNMTTRGTYSAAIAKISEALVKVDGRATDGSGAYRWWSTTEKGTDHVYTLVVNEGAVGDRTKYNSTGNENYARPVLSF